MVEGRSREIDAMKKALLTGIAALLLATEVSHAGSIGSGNYWIPRCRAPLSWSNPKMNLPYEDVWDGGYCHGLVTGIMLTLSDVCIPDGVTVGQFLKIIIETTDRHPEILHKNFLIIVEDIALKTWPCKK